MQLCVQEASRPSQDDAATNGAAAAEAETELPDTFTKDGRLVDPKRAIQGVPALRVSRVEVVLGKGKSETNGIAHADAASLEPTDAQKAHRDPAGA